MTSFNQTLGSMAFAWYQQLRDGSQDPVLRLMVSKSARHELLGRIGVPHARLLHTVTSQTLTEAHLSGPCVLKPDRGATGIGVMALVPGEPGRWLDVRRGRSYDMDAIRDLMRAVLERDDQCPDLWLIEELLNGRPGDGLVEYGCYTFAGGRDIPLIRGARTRSGRSSKRWFTADGTPTEVEQPGWMHPVDDTIPAPEDMPGLLDLARASAAAVPAAFVRVGVYAADRGYLVGEVNPTDGYRNGFVASWDEVLGGLLDAARAQEQPGKTTTKPRAARAKTGGAKRAPRRRAGQ